MSMFLICSPRSAKRFTFCAREAQAEIGREIEDGDAVRNEEVAADVVGSARR